MSKLEQAIADLSRLAREHIDDWEVLDEVDDLIWIIQEEINKLRREGMYGE